MVIKVSKDSFEQEVLKADGPVIVDFFATWCSPCQKFAPIFEQLSLRLQEHKFVKINIDENANLAIQYGITSIPTMVIFKNGQVLSKDFPGGLELSELQAKIEASLN